MQLMDFNIAPARGSRDEATRDAPPGAGTKQTLAIAGTRTRRAARDEDQIALELAEAESRREALEEGTAAAPASTAPIARTRQPEPDEEGMPETHQHATVKNHAAHAADGCK